VGNPPFLGGTRISTLLGMPYFSWLTKTFPPAGHLCDLVAYFFRRAFGLLRAQGAFGLIATNTIAQGDTRKGGLSTIVRDGGVIYSATRRFRWPGPAAVIVSVVHIAKREMSPPYILDGLEVQRITAFLFHSGSDDEPARLVGRNALFSAGTKIYGQGFLFADDDEKATPLFEMYRILDSDSSYGARILPYLGGDEVNQDPKQSYERYVIYLSDIQKESELAQWPELARIVKERVKPDRDRLGDNPNNVPLRRRWWAYQAHRPDLYQALSRMRRALVSSQTSKYITFSFQPSGIVFSHRLNVFLYESWSAFCLLQSRAHEIWALFFCSTLEDRPVYAATDCFETFPFPPGWENDPRLEEAGRAYYEFRASLMVENDEGLTDTFNRFHDPDERTPGILKLRELHGAMDRTVLDAFGWTEIQLACEFVLDDEDEDEEEGPRRRKRPWRYRWSDETRDEVLARLLVLNLEQAQAEGQIIAPAPTSAAKWQKQLAKTSAGQGSLLGPDET
jgi:hypothetical protein